MPVRFYAGTFALSDHRLRISVASGCPSLVVRLARDLPYPSEQIRAVTVVQEGGRLFVEVCAEVPVASYEQDAAPDPARVVGVDLGVIHPFALAGPDGLGLLVSGSALRAESRLHLAERRARARAVARRAPKKGVRGSRRWRKYRRRSAILEARHRRRLAQARHEAAKTVVAFAIAHRIGTLVVGDPVGVLELKAGRRHNQRLRDWRPGESEAVLLDKAERAAISVVVVDERGSSSTCPRCRHRVPKPKGRSFACPYCNLVGHRDLVGAVNIAARAPRGGQVVSMPDTLTHRRAGRHLPGAGRSRRDPRRTRWEIRRVLREPWPAVARPEDLSSGSSSSTVNDGDRGSTNLAEQANVGRYGTRAGIAARAGCCTK